MSEYQYYEFLAVDRTLTPQQIAQVRRHSSRAEISATHFTNEYTFGDFHGDVDELLTDFYDLHVYTANWATHTFAMGIPAASLDLDLANQYTGDYGLEVKKKPSRLILTLSFVNDGGDLYDESSGEGWMAKLAPLREEILSGDYRSLYLAWLCGISQTFDEDLPEPPLPAGLKNLTKAQKALVEFLYLDSHLVQVAAEPSPDRAAHAPDITAWLKTLPAQEKDAWLADLLAGEVAAVTRRLRDRLRQDNPASTALTTTNRTSGELLKAAENRAQQAELREQERKARQKAQREAEAAAAREQYLRQIAPNAAQLWKQAENLIATRLPKNYDQAVTVLRDLRDLASLNDEIEQFQRQFAQLRDRHMAKHTLQDRLDKLL